MTEQEWLTSEDPAAMLRWATDLYTGQRPHISDRKLRLLAVACCRQPEVWDRLTDDAPCGRCSGHSRVLGMGTPRTDCPDCGGTGRINRSRRAVEVAENYADGLATEEEVLLAEHDAALAREPNSYSFNLLAGYCLFNDANYAAGRVVDTWKALGQPPATQAALLRCIAGNPWRPVTGLDDVVDSPVGAGKLTGENERGYPKVNHIAVTWYTTRLESWLAHNDGAVVKLATVIYQERTWDELGILADALEEAGCEHPPCEFCKDADFATNDLGTQMMGGKEPYASREKAYWASKCVCKGTRKGTNPILAHLRGPGPHARGCWVLDLLTGRE